MGTQIFVNLPVKNLSRSIDFFSQLGYTFNKQFTDEKSTCMIVADDIFVMLLVEDFFTTFTKKPIADTKNYNEAILCISIESKFAVDEIVSKAVAAGASASYEKQEESFMYGHGFQDLDGHLWEFIWMDMAAMPPK